MRWQQYWQKWLALIGGFVFLAAILDGVSNALQLVTPRITLIGTFFSVTLCIVIEVIIRIVRPLWRFADGTVARLLTIQGPHRWFICGMVVLLWVPRAIDLLKSRESLAATPKVESAPIAPPLVGSEGQGEQTPSRLATKNREETIPALPEKREPTLPKPRLDLVFLMPASLSLGIVHHTGAPIKSPKYSVLMMNLDNPANHELMAGNVFLPALSATLDDFIRPTSVLGPIEMASQWEKQGLLRKGDRLFGMASVDCFDCSSPRYYYVYATHGAGGNYCETSHSINPSHIFETADSIQRGKQPMNQLCPQGITMVQELTASGIKPPVPPTVFVDCTFKLLPEAMPNGATVQVYDSVSGLLTRAIVGTADWRWHSGPGYRCDAKNHGSEALFDVWLPFRVAIAERAGPLNWLEKPISIPRIQAGETFSFHAFPQSGRMISIQVPTKGSAVKSSVRTPIQVKYSQSTIVLLPAKESPR